mgnify:FL=1
MKFSIVIPAYNVAVYLENCLKSILDQSYDNYEIIIVNDGSTDKTGKVADNLADQYEQITVIHQSNGGASKARNTGMKNVTGDYVLFLDGDDFWSDSHFLEQISSELDRELVDVVIFGYSYYYEDEIRESAISRSNDLIEVTNFGLFNGPNWNKCISKELINKGLSFPEDLVSEDSLYCSSIMKMMESFSVITSTQYMYRQNRAGSLTNVVKERNVLDTLEGISRGLSDEKSLSEVKRKALNTYFTISYISILPYAKPYLFNQEIRNLLIQYKYLLKNSSHINNKSFKMTGIFTSIFGINISTRLFSYLLKFYKK